ncbi:Aste57867_24001 [Aphanomyces stellatus]|uniref:Aste57867_24001 protein n=1 Tax=Aphanomyces stellatus TaxID=120398 RepID=A0A485LP86_9STRA|nr:hypothetical protein As57867_023928 [Aphanomyces stellatus]VFU00644.1 Aste57867_24001 [Aphanomyces stellatus]
MFHIMRRRQTLALLVLAVLTTMCMGQSQTLPVPPTPRPPKTDPPQTPAPPPSPSPPANTPSPPTATPIVVPTTQPVNTESPPTNAPVTAKPVAVKPTAPATVKPSTATTEAPSSGATAISQTTTTAPVPPVNDTPSTTPPSPSFSQSPSDNTTTATPAAASVPGAAASSTTKSPTSTPGATGSVSDSTSAGLSMPVVVGVSSTAVVLVAGLGYWLVRRRRMHRAATTATTTDGPTSVFLSMTLSSTETGLNWKPLEPFQVPLDEIELTKSVAAGAFGEVWLGTFRGDVVAVKTCLASKASRKNLQHFIDELALMGTLASPHIVQLLGAAWFRPTDLKAVLEFMDTGDLKDHLDTTTPATFSWKNKLECALSIAKALVYLKEKQVIHRDLKSRNVLLDSEKGTKLADFGISREDSQHTMTTGVGTYRWMAPEVLTFKYYTIAVDVFSFGVLLSELDTHQIPYTDVRNDQGQPISDTAIVGMVLYNGLRPTFSGPCLPWVKELALRCMNTVADERPHPMEIAYVIAAHLRDDFA